MHGIRCRWDTIPAKHGTPPSVGIRAQPIHGTGSGFWGWRVDRSSRFGGARWHSERQSIEDRTADHRRSHHKRPSPWLLKPGRGPSWLGNASPSGLPLLEALGTGRRIRAKAHATADGSLAPRSPNISSRANWSPPWGPAAGTGQSGPGPRSASENLLRRSECPVRSSLGGPRWRQRGRTGRLRMPNRTTSKFDQAGSTSVRHRGPARSPKQRCRGCYACRPPFLCSTGAEPFLRPDRDLAAAARSGCPGRPKAGARARYTLDGREHGGTFGPNRDRSESLDRQLKSRFTVGRVQSAVTQGASGTSRCA